MTNIIPPRIIAQDPLFEARQAVALYGEEITPAQVVSTLRTIEAFQSHQRGYAGDRGPVVAKHFRQGHKEAIEWGINMILDSLLESGQPFEDLLQGWSRSGAQSQVLYSLRHLETAIQANIWGSIKDEDEAEPEEFSEAWFEAQTK